MFMYITHTIIAHSLLLKLNIYYIGHCIKKIQGYNNFQVYWNQMSVVSFLLKCWSGFYTVIQISNPDLSIPSYIV